MIRYSDTDKHPYVLRRHYLQLGWIVFDKNTKERVIHTPSKEHAIKVYERLEKAVSNGDKIIVSTKVTNAFKPKLLVISGWRDDTYLLIDDEIKFSERLAKYLKYEIESKNGSLKKRELNERLISEKENLLTDEQIKALPNQTLRNSIIESQVAHEAEVKAIENHNELVDKINKCIKNNNYKQLWHRFLMLENICFLYAIITDFYE